MVYCMYELQWLSFFYEHIFQQAGMLLCYRIKLVSDFFSFTTFLLSLNFFSLSLKEYKRFFKLKQFPKMSEGKFKKITLYYKNISPCRIRVLGLFVVDVAIGAASQWQSEASL